MEYKNLETGRLILKTINYEDLDFICTHFSDNQVNKYLYDEEPVKNLEEAKDLIDFYVNSDSKIQCRWIIIDKITGLKIGTCGFHKHDSSLGNINIRYDLNKDHWGKGYMTEALTEIITYAWINFDIKRIHAKISELNLESQKLIDKLCFKKVDSYNIEFREKNFMHFKYELSKDNWTNCSLYKSINNNSFISESDSITDI